MRKKAVVTNLILTIIGGIAFLSCQAWEWHHLFTEGAWWGRNPFPNADGTIASTNFTNYFFTITGFHGFHVFIGMLMLLFITLRLQKGHFTPTKHFGFEGAAWYWHFVDVVWLGLYILVYWM